MFPVARGPSGVLVRDLSPTLFTNEKDVMTSESYYPLPATLLPRILISPLAGIGKMMA